MTAPGSGALADLPPLVALAVCDNGRERPEPVQIGACLLDAGRAGEPVTWLVRPTAPIAPVMTSRVHGLTDADVADAPDLAEIWSRVSDVVGGRLLVVHNAGRITGMFAGLPDPGVTGVLDTLRLARRRRVSVAGSYALAPLLAATRVNATPAPRFERADWTARATAALFAHLVRLPPPVRFDVLATWCRADTPTGWTELTGCAEWCAGWAGSADPVTRNPWPTVLREPTPPALPNPAIGP